MRKSIKKNPYLLVGAMCALMLLGSCNFGETEKKPSDPEGPVLPDIAVSAVHYSGPGAGEYFNPMEGVSLRIDGAGGFVLSAAEGRVEGTYSATEDEIVFLCGGEELRAQHRGEGLTAQGLSGIFLPAERRESFSALGISVAFDREYSEGEDGSYSLRDYVLELGLSYPGSMSAPENLIADAVVVWDRGLGYVTGRNVTGEFFGEAEDFMEEYMRARVLTDFRLLYGEEGSFEEMELLDEGVSGRLSSAEGLIKGADKRIYVKTIMYTSTYADGTVNYICKCFFAPEEDERSFNALANSVTNMTAVRRR